MNNFWVKKSLRIKILSITSPPKIFKINLIISIQIGNEIKNTAYSVVEKLLQLLICVVDAELLEAVHLEDLEPSNIENTDKTCPLPLGTIQRTVNPRHDPFEQSLVGGLGNRFDGEFDLLLGLSLGDIVAAHLDPGFQERLGQVSDLDAKQMCNLKQN